MKMTDSIPMMGDSTARHYIAVSDIIVKHITAAALHCMTFIARGDDAIKAETCRRRVSQKTAPRPALSGAVPRKASLSPCSCAPQTP